MHRSPKFPLCMDRGYGWDRCARTWVTVRMRLSGRQRRVRAGRGASLRRPALRAGCPAMLGLAGPVAELTTFAALTAFKQPRRVRARSALRARATSPALLGAEEARPVLPARAFARQWWRAPNAVRSNRASLPSRSVLVFVARHYGCIAAGGTRRGRFVWRREGEPGHEQSSGLSVPGERPGHWPGAACKARALSRRAQRASTSDSSRLFERSSRSERSEFGDAT